MGLPLHALKEVCVKPDIKLILDSGAFSCWTKKEKIDIDEYIKFILKYDRYITYAVNLDVIPGSPGIKPTAQQIEESASKGYENYQYMVEKGVPKDKLIHIFHQHENFKWLKRMVGEMQYIGLSPANDLTTKEKFIWLDECMKYVCDKEGLPIIKFHGFAVTSITLITRYPWYSVDSTAWMMTASFGSFFIPRLVDGEWDYVKNPIKVDCSIKSMSNNHYYHMTDIERKIVDNYVESYGFKMGKSELRNGKEVVIEEGVCNQYWTRRQLNAIFFLELQKRLLYPRKYKTRRTGLF